MQTKLANYAEIMRILWAIPYNIQPDIEFNRKSRDSRY